MRKTDINYSIIRAKRNGCGCPAHHSSLFSFLSSLRASRANCALCLMPYALKNGCPAHHSSLFSLLQGGQSRNRPLIGVIAVLNL